MSAKDLALDTPYPTIEIDSAGETEHTYGTIDFKGPEAEFFLHKEASWIVACAGAANIVAFLQD